MMTLRIKFILFVVILHLVTLVLSYYVFRENKILFIAAEVLVMVSIVLSYLLYRGMIRPLQTLMTGVDAIRDKDFNVRFLQTGQFEMDQLINVYNNMMDHLRDERTRQEQQHFFLEKLIQTSPTGIIIADFDGKIRQVNPKACEQLGIEVKDVFGLQMEEVNVPMIREIAQLHSGEAKTVTVNGIQTFKIQRSQFVDHGFPRTFVMIEELTAEILAAEKKVYGKVIRMMAHEVNNTLGPVNSILQTTLKTADLWQEGKNQQLANALQVALDRNQNLNLFMRNFADVVRLPEPVKNNLDLHRLLTNVITLMQMKAGEKQIRFEWALATTPVYILADEQQLEQVFINIVKNAMEAIESSGTIVISTSHQPKIVTITDSGKGISSEHSEHLFSPFFSTKRDGQGVGLTLVKEILLNHGFEFSLKTVRDGETVFTIELNS